MQEQQSKSGIPYDDFGGQGEIVHLAHANGFPPESYAQFCKQLISDYKVLAMYARPLWPNQNPDNFKSWVQAADDLICFLDDKGFSRIIGIGHSFGAICTIIAANKRPDLFSKIVLIEPVVLPKWYYRLANLLPDFILKRINPVVNKTLVRTDKWDSKQEIFDQFRYKNVFAQMGDEALWDYVHSVSESDTNNRIKLRYSKEWEARIFLTVTDPWNQILDLKHPFITFRGKNSDTIRKEVWDKWSAMNKVGILNEIDNTGHLIPFEKPELLALRVKDFLKN